MRIGWLVGCFGLSGPLRQYFSLYRAVSPKEAKKKKEMIDERKMSKQPPPAPTASTLPYTYSKTSDAPVQEVYPAPSLHPTTPKYEEFRSKILFEYAFTTVFFSIKLHVWYMKYHQKV